MVVAARIECAWRCDDHDIDPDITCAKDPSWQKERNCRGETGKKQLFGGWEFDVCPVRWLARHPMESMIFHLYYQCCGGTLLTEAGAVSPMIHLPFSGGINEQPAVLLDAFGIMTLSLSSLSGDIQNRQKP